MVRKTMVVQRRGREFVIEDLPVNKLKIRLNDQMLNLDQPIKVTHAGQTLYEGKVPRTIATVATTVGRTRRSPRDLLRGGGGGEEG